MPSWKKTQIIKLPCSVNAFCERLEEPAMGEPWLLLESWKAKVCWEMGKQSGWKQLWLLETGELGWGLQQAGAALCSPTHPHTSILPSCLCA